MLGIIGLMAVAVVFNDAYQEAFEAILPLPANFTQGLALTLYLTVGSFVVATVLGLFIGLARMSRNTRSGILPPSTSSSSGASRSWCSSSSSPWC